MKELYGLERVLVAIKSLNIDHLLSDEVSTLRQAIRDCQTFIDNFLKTIESYQSLTAGKSSLRDQMLKVKWALGHRDDVQNFREILDTRTTSLSLLLNTIQFGHSLTLEEKTEDRLKQQSLLLGEIQASILAKAAEHLQLLRQIEGLPLPQSRAKPDDQSITSRFTLPFKLKGAPLAPAFVQRTEVMQAIEDQLLPISETKQTVLVLHGMGGIGKSQMAREYACKHNDEYTAIFWINARSKNTLKDGIASIAGRLRLTDIPKGDEYSNKVQDNTDRAVLAVLNWFNEDGNIRWLLILDNVDSQLQFDSDNDDEERSSNTEDFDALPLIPSSSQGTLLVTSRSWSLARTFGGTTVSIDQMTLSEGMEVLCRLSRRKSHETGAEELVKRLGYYPLALSQCGRYISETQDSFVSYLTRYETELKSLLTQNLSIREYQNGSIDATLGLSYEALQAQNPTSAALLAFCSCLDNTDIFWKLFETGYCDTSDFPPVKVPALSWIPGLDPDWFQKIQSDEELYDGAVRSLLMFSFARQNFETSSISIHPIVHRWSLSLYGRDLRKEVLEKIADLISRHTLLNVSFKRPTPSVRALSTRLRPHADRCFALIRSEGTNLRWVAAATLISFGYYFSRQNQNKCAEPLVIAGLPLLECEEKCYISFKCLKLRWKVTLMYQSWDQDHGKRIANLCVSLKLARALKLQVRDDAISVLEMSCTRELSILYMEQGRYSEASKMWDLAVEHSADKDWNAAVYWTAMTAKTEMLLLVGGDTAEAVRLGEETVLNIRRQLEAATAADPSLSSESYYALEDTLAHTQHLLGSAYSRVPNWEKSQECYLSSLIRYEKKYGPTGIFTLMHAANYMCVVDEWVTKRSIELRENWCNAVHDLLLAANPNRILHSVKKRTPKSCKYDRWILVLSAVRTSVRHRPGTELYNWVSKKENVNTPSTRHGAVQLTVEEQLRRIITSTLAILLLCLVNSQRHIYQ